MAWHGFEFPAAGPGTAGLGPAWLGTARRGMDLNFLRRGGAWLGTARRGEARHGMVWICNRTKQRMGVQ